MFLKRTAFSQSTALSGCIELNSKARIIDPQWIIDSIEKKKLQSFTKYTILRDPTSCIDKYLSGSSLNVSSKYSL